MYYIVAFILGVGAILYGIYNLIIYIRGKKVEAIISNVEVINREEGYSKAYYTYTFNINNETKVIEGPMQRTLFSPTFSKKFGKRVQISYDERTDKVSLKLHTIIGWIALGTLIVGWSTITTQSIMTKLI